MSITQIISQDSAESPQNRQKTTEQALYRSRLGQKVAALLQKQAKGKFLNNSQKRQITRWQRGQLLAAVEVAL
jgi:hypothetical protein